MQPKRKRAKQINHRISPSFADGFPAVFRSGDLPPTPGWAGSVSIWPHLLSRKFNLRAGSEFFTYSTTFIEQGAHVAANLRLQSAHASLDWFPFRNGFRVSPLLVFANNNRGRASAVVPPGGHHILKRARLHQQCRRTPLRGAGSVDFRKISPGLSLGFGNIVPRSGKRFTFPVEAGFYYAGQPGLKVALHRQRVRSHRTAGYRLPIGGSRPKLPTKPGGIYRAQ